MRFSLHIKAAVILVLFLLGGCVNKQFYEGEKLPPNQISSLFTSAYVELKEHQTLATLRIMNIDDKPIVSTKKYDLLPKNYEIWGSLQVHTTKFSELLFSKPSKVRSGGFLIKLSAKAGQTYVPTVKRENDLYEVCIIGEDHDASGHWVNPTGEIRKPSNNAIKVGCYEINASSLE